MVVKRWKNGELANCGLFFMRHRSCDPRLLDHKKFSEPGALSSSTPTNFRLPPTAYRSGIDLLASRARCKGESRGRPARGQEPAGGKRRNLRLFPFASAEVAIRAFWTTKNSASRWRFRPLLRPTFPLARTRLPVEPRPTRAPCSLQEGSYGLAGEASRGWNRSCSQIATFSLRTGLFCACCRKL